MVSHHPEWKDVEDGYTLEDAGVFVSPAIVQSGPHSTSHRSGGIPEDEANAYAVEVRTRMGTASETWDPVANFTNPRTAWEFANLLTHFFEAKFDADFAKNDLLSADHQYTGESKSLPDIVTDLTAQKAFLTLLHPDVVPEPMEDIIDDDLNL